MALFFPEFIECILTTVENIVFHDMIYQGVLCFIVEGDRDSFQLVGLMESPSVDDDGDCFSPLQLNATSINIEVYYNKAVNYTLMVTFVSFSHQLSFYFTFLLLSVIVCFSFLSSLNSFSVHCCVISLMYLYQISFLQVLLLIRQMEHSNTQSVRNCLNILFDLLCYRFSEFN